MIWAISFLLTFALASPARSFDTVAVEGLLADEDFFRAATCGAAPGTVCLYPPLRWPKTSLTLAVVTPELDTSYLFRVLLGLCVDHALLQINRAGSGLTITRLPNQAWATGADVDIRLGVTDIPPGSPVPDVAGLSAPGIMGVGYASLWWTESREITSASILISQEIGHEDIVSVVLEEIFQATGPLFDIDSPAYEGISILSETSNQTFSITGQDARLLRWLYPPQPPEMP